MFAWLLVVWWVGVVRCVLFVGCCVLCIAFLFSFFVLKCVDCCLFRIALPLLVIVCCLLFVVCCCLVLAADCSSLFVVCCCLVVLFWFVFVVYCWV